MTERLKSAFGSNMGHVITVVITFSMMLIAYGRLEQRQAEQERRIGKVEECLSPLGERMARVESKIDLLLLRDNQKTAQKDRL